MAVDPSFPCSLSAFLSPLFPLQQEITTTDHETCRIIDVPFPTARLAAIALKALSVDKELSPSVRRSFSVRSAETSEGASTSDAGNDGPNENSILRTVYEATTNRMLRVSVNAFLDHVGLVVDVMEGLDVDVLAAEEQAPNAPNSQPAVEA